MSLLVTKFGGSSVASLEKIHNVALRLQELRKEGYQLAVIVSAMGDTTDELLEMARQIGSESDPREMDMLLATGEQQSAALLTLTLQSMGIPAVSLTGWQAGIMTDNMHSKACILNIVPEKIQEELNKDRIVVIAGFQGLSLEGNVTTLGRGGSDTSAVALAAVLKAERCKIFTDVDGVFTADPRIVKEAKQLQQVSYEEMLEMASLGAGVLQPRAAECAMLHQVELEVLNSFKSQPGTIILEGNRMEHDRNVSGIAHDLNVARMALFDVPDQPGIAAHIFKKLAENSINVDMVIQSATRGHRNDIAFTIDSHELNRALPIVNEIVEEIGASGMSYGKDVAKISIVGAGMQSNPGVAAAMFEALADDNINIHMIATSEIKVSCIIDETEVEKAVRALHAKFELDKVE